MSEEPVVVTENLTKKYGEFTALDRLTITLSRGHILGFIGPNGAGKTTMIKILVGLTRATSGRAWIAGNDCSRNFKEIRRMVGYMPDVFGGYDNMRVREYLDFFGATYKIPRLARQRRIEETMELTGSTYMKDMYVGSLSHGMKQRVGIARTLLHDPQVLILDEPANGLDPNARIEMRQILLRLSEMGKTLIVTSHILPELSRICNQVAIITHGKLRASGSLEEIMRQVRQRRLIEVQLVDASGVEGVAQIIRELISDATEVTPSTTEAMVRFSTSDEEESLAQLLSRLTANGTRISQFREVPMDLEDAFLSVTQQDGQHSELEEAEPAEVAD